MNKVNEQIFLLHKKFHKKIYELINQDEVIKLNEDLPPKFYPDVKNEKILFLGLNPSFSKEEFEKYSSGLEENNKPWFSWNAVQEQSKFEEATSKIISLQENFKHGTDKVDKLPYYKSIEKFCKEIDNHISYESVYHYDLFQFRITKQNTAREVIDKISNSNEFVNSSLEILHNVIATVKPTIIIVANALASKIIQTNLLKNEKIDEVSGCYYLHQIPVYFTSQLTGGATDKFSRERLAWLIRKYLRTNEIKL